MSDSTKPNTNTDAEAGGIAALFRGFADKYDQDLRGATSPFRREIAPDKVIIGDDKTAVISKTNNSFKLLDYQWFPSDIKRRFADDYYNNIEIAFAKVQSATTGGFLSGIKEAVVDKVNEISNTVEDSINGIKDSVNNVKDMLTGTKKKKIEKNLSNQFNDFIMTFPYAKIYEFKPQDDLGATVSGLATAFKMIDNIVDGAAGFKDTVKAIIDGFYEFILTEFKIDLKNPSSFTDPNARILGIPNKLYKNIISGYYTAYYEIPLLENGDFLSSKGTAGWTQQGFVERYFGTAGSSIKSFMADNIGSGLDIATKPKWSIEGGGEPFKDITIKVMLFNDNIASTFNNLAFIHSFVAGNLWYQDTLIQKASSLYDVELPGRLRYYFCTCDIEVNFVGKVRVLSQGLTYDNVLDKDVIKKDLAKYNIPLTVLSNMNVHVLNNIPDMYEVTFTFHPLLPNNYNTYCAYLRGASEDDVKGVGTQINNVWEQLAKGVDAKVQAANNKTAATQEANKK